VRKAIEAASARLGAAGRLVVRPSGTEPLIRVMGEADDAALLDEVVAGVVEAIGAAAAAAA
jgi:phosphoglucosamine mutase